MIPTALLVLVVVASLLFRPTDSIKPSWELLTQVVQASGLLFTIWLAYMQLAAGAHAARAEAFLQLEQQLADQRHLRRRVHETYTERQGQPLRAWVLREDAEEPVDGAGDVAVRLNVLAKLVEAGHLDEGTVLDMLSGTILDMWYRLAEPVRLERIERDDAHYLVHFQRLARRAKAYRAKRRLSRRPDPVMHRDPGI